MAMAPSLVGASWSMPARLPRHRRAGAVVSVSERPPVPRTILNTPTGEVLIPSIGYGVWQVPTTRSTSAVGTALEAGYRHIDTGIYGNEAGVGRALKATSVPRDEIFVTTKVWNSDHGREGTLRAFDASMRRLGLEVLDLYLIHWPVPSLDRYLETWAARTAGRRSVRAIGVCNFHEGHLRRVEQESGEWPAINQIELHPTSSRGRCASFRLSGGSSPSRGVRSLRASVSSTTR